MAQEEKFEGDVYRDKLDFQSYITRQLIRIGELSSRIYETPRANMWQKNALNYYFAISSLLSTISPYLDDGISEKIKEIEKTAQERYKKRQEDKKKSKLTKKSKFFDVKDTLDVSNEILKIIMENLKEKGLLLEEETFITQY